MDGLKDVLSFLGALFGLISAVIPLLGYLADRRRRANALAETRPDVARTVAENAPGLARGAAMPAPETARPLPAGRAGFARAEQLVRSPAIFMIAVAALSLTTNLFTAGIGFIDKFVTPLGIKPQREIPMRGAPGGPFGDRAMPPEMPDSDHGNAVLGLVGILFFSFASTISIWSGYNMLKLRNYGLALAGSIALMPGSCMCCLLGFPAGI